MALFECCSKQFVKDTGRTTLHPVLDLNSSTRSNILFVVVKKKSRWFWKPIKYSPTPFTLNNLLTKPVDISCLGIKSSEFITQYKNEPKFHVDGKLGAKIATEFGIDVTAIDSFTVSMDIGTVTKKEVSWQTLNSVLSDSTLNLDQEFVQYILSKKRKSLCVIYETVTTRGDLDLNAVSQVEGDANVSAGKPKFSINLSGSIQETQHRSFELPGSTVLGFACYELNVDSGMGTLHLVLDDVADAPGRKYHVFDEPDGQSDRALEAVFDDLFKSSQHSQIIENFRKILSFPKVAPALRDLLEDVLSSAEGGEQKPSAVVDFKARAGEGFESCRDLLTLMGFMMEKSNDDGGKIAFSKDSSVGLLTCCTGLAEALVELSAPQCRALQQVTPQHIDPLLYLLKNALYGRSTPADDPLLQRVWTHSTNPAKEFLLTLGFEQVTEGDRKVLRLNWDFEHTSLEDSYVSVFVLCSKC